MKENDIFNLPIYRQQKGEYLLKTDIVTNFPQNFMISKNNKYEYATTSGTTSDRMEIIRKVGWWQEEYKRTYSNNSELKKYFEKSLHKVIFTTAQCSNLICFVDKPPLEKRIIGNTLYVNNTFNPWSWTNEDIEQITDEINYFKPFYMDADPIYLSVYLFLKEKYKITTKVHTPKVITLSYEFVPQNTKRYINKHFDTSILNLYGTTEFGYIFLENKGGKMSLCRDLVDIKLLPIDKKNNLYTLIVDSYKNEYMPLINYRVGDMVIATEDQIKNFNQNHEITKMAGREKDLINGNISASMIDEMIEKNDNILFYQLYFISDDKVVFKYITIDGKELSEKEEDTILRELKELGISIDISFSKVMDIKPEMSGKFATIKRGV